MIKYIYKYKGHLSVIGLFILLFLIPLSWRPILMPDEPRYGEIPREMLVSGDWIVPHFNGLRYLEKPVFGYWVQAASIRLFGENAFALRLPSSLSVAGTLLILFALMRGSKKEIEALLQTAKPGVKAAPPPVHFQDRGVILMTAFIYLTCLEVYAVGSFALLDSMFSLFVTGSTVSLFLAWNAGCHDDSKVGLYLVAAGVFCGVAFMTKGFLAILLPSITIIPFLIWQGDWKGIFRLGWLPALAAVLTALPWSFAVHVREPGFWKYFIVHEHFNRFMGQATAQHKESFWLFFMWLPLVIFPWSFLLPAAVRGFVKVGKQRPLLRFLICWFVFPFLFFSISDGKLLTYILPCLAPFSILMALGLREYRQSGGFILENLGLFLLAFFSAILLLGVLLAGTGAVGDSLQVHLAGIPWILLMIGLLSLSGIVLINLNCKTCPGKYTSLALAPVCLYLVLSFLLPLETLSKKAPADFLQSLNQQIDETAILVSDESMTGSVCWFLKRNDVLILDKAGEFEYGLAYPDAAERHLDFNSFDALVKQIDRTRQIVLIMRSKHYHQWKSSLSAEPQQIVWNEGHQMVALIY